MYENFTYESYSKSIMVTFIKGKENGRKEYSSKTKKWLIKSFHLSEKNDNSIMLAAFQKAGLIKMEDKNGK